MRNAIPNIYTALKLIATIPVTSCKCERAVSFLRRLKTYLRSTMSQNQLNFLAIKAVHREIDIHQLAIVQRFARKYPHRMEIFYNLKPDYMRRGGPLNRLARKMGQPTSMVCCLLIGN